MGVVRLFAMITGYCYAKQLEYKFRVCQQFYESDPTAFIFTAMNRMNPHTVTSTVMAQLLGFGLNALAFVQC